ncbi:MAG: RpiB/LacA/LacB family sugar-phosphate isomerase [Erysipelotrichaceae bacterium]|jgi:ribose 5-phosphate isomerase B|nr:RpiB/LacA/LacB family sugar-phosphate isomerase [Erysipelotrichaceae bacterium]
MKNIVVGSDHAGFEYKEAIKKHLVKLGYQVVDVGTFSTESVGYPSYGHEAGKKIIAKAADLGVLVCGTGEGIMIAANKVAGIRCGIGYDDAVASLIVQHNNANMISFGSRTMDLKDVLRRVEIFLSATFLGERHAKRVADIEKIC